MFRVIDVETTGLDPETCKVVEIAGMDLVSSEGGWVECNAQEYIVNPGVPIPPENSAIHHLTDEDVQHQPGLEEVLPFFTEDWDGGYFVAHNARFDRAFLPSFGPVDRWVCTKKLAARLWPDAPSHSNQVLRYWLKVQVPKDIGMPHRALPDVFVTAQILVRILQESGWSIEQMVEMSQQPTLLRKCTFGKHAETLWKDVPKDYLRWVLKPHSDPFDEDVLHTARHYLNGG